MNINQYKRQPDTLQNFTAGFTRKMKQEAMRCDVYKISRDLSKKGINCDFKDNRIIAWCVYKSAGIIDEINNRFNLQLGLPVEVVVEDFNLLRLKESVFAFCNFAPTKLYKINDKITQGKVIFINEFKEYSYKNGNKFWENIDNISDIEYANKNAPTDFFLNVFLHEFGHIMHEQNMLNKMGGYSMIDKLAKVLLPEALIEYQNMYKKIVSVICDYASYSPLETVACDLSKRLVENLDKNRLIPCSNFIKDSPYTQNLLRIFTEFNNPLNRLLRNIWNGNFKTQQGRQNL